MEVIKIPWLVPESISVIEQLLTRDSKVFEFGCGGSTLWLSERCKYVMTVDHSWEWYSEIALMAGNNVFMSRQDTPYHHICDCLDDEYFDLALVDGRNRPRCMVAIAPKIKPGGYLILDNAEREHNLPGINWLLENGFEIHECFISNEEKPYVGWTTTIYQKRK